MKEKKKVYCFVLFVSLSLSLSTQTTSLTAKQAISFKIIIMTIFFN